MSAHASPASDQFATQLSLPSNAPAKGKPFLEYKRREPEKTVLFGIVSQHLDAFLRHTRETYARPIPKYVCHPGREKRMPRPRPLRLVRSEVHSRTLT